jgi:hypothetical protein
MVTPRATALIRLVVLNVVNTISQYHVPNHANHLPSVRYAMAIIRLTTRDALSIKNFNNDADILPIPSKSLNNSSFNISTLSLTINQQIRHSQTHVTELMLM